MGHLTMVFILLLTTLKRLITNVMCMAGTTVNYSKKPGSFKEQNVVFSAQIHGVTLTKTWF